MTDALVYLRLGFEHLLDAQGYDHLVFIAALTASYGWREWRRLLVLVTAFTLGHTLTLALATLDAVRVEAALVEVLIPLTIFLTALYTIWQVHHEERRLYHVEERRLDRFRYALALGFGLIHGLGFSGFLRSVLGAEENLLLPLVAFNVGLEVAQLVVLTVLLAVGALVMRLRFPPAAWAYVISGAAAGIGLVLLVERLGA